MIGELSIHATVSNFDQEEREKKTEHKVISCPFPRNTSDIIASFLYKMEKIRIFHLHQFTYEQANKT